MSTMQALVADPFNLTAVVSTISIPEPGPNEIRFVIVLAFFLNANSTDLD